MEYLGTEVYYSVTTHAEVRKIGTQQLLFDSNPWCAPKAACSKVRWRD